MEAYDVVVAEAVFVASGKVAINAVAYLRAGSVDGNGFADEERAVRTQRDIAVKIENTFGLRAKRSRIW